MKKQVKKTIRPGKEIVASMAEEFREKLFKIVKQGIKDITIDLKGVGMVDSVGLGVLIATHNSLEDNGGVLRIKNVSDDIYSLFKTMRLDQHFEITPAK